MFISRPDAQLHVLSFGHGPLTLLALGGWIGSGEVWLDLFGHLPHWRCIAVDHRGTGASSHRGRITVDAMAADILAVADALNVQSCLLAAESAGAAVALAAVQRAPKRFLGQVLVGAAWQHVPPGASDGFIAQLRSDYTATLRTFIDRCLPETPSPDLRRWALQMLKRASVEDAVALLNCRSLLAPEDAGPRVALPTLLVHGSQDRIVPPHSSTELAARLDHAQVELMPGLGHIPILTEPQAVAKLIDSFGVRLSMRAAATA